MTTHYLLKQHEAFSKVAEMPLDSAVNISTVLNDAFFNESRFAQDLGEKADSLELQLAKHCDPKFTKFAKEGDSEANLEELKKLAEKFVAKANPEPKFSRIISTYNLKALLTGAAAYGSFVFGFTPIGLALAGVATFFATKFVASHVSAYKAVHSDFAALYGKEDDTAFKKTKAFFKNGFGNVFQFMKEVTYKAASKGMLDSTIVPNRKEDGKLSGSFYGLTDLGLYNKEFTADNFDIKSLGMDAVAALASVLTLIYAPIAAPLYRLFFAVAPMASFAPFGNYAINYAKQEKAVPSSTVKAEADAPKAPETSLEDQLAAAEEELKKLQDSKGPMAAEVEALRVANTTLLGTASDASGLGEEDKKTHGTNEAKAVKLEADLDKLDGQIKELEASIQDLNQKIEAEKEAAKKAAEATPPAPANTAK